MINEVKHTSLLWQGFKTVLWLNEEKGILMGKLQKHS
jgi:hypothetical protein